MTTQNEEVLHRHMVIFSNSPSSIQAPSDSAVFVGPLLPLCLLLASSPTGRGADQEDREGGGADLVRRPRQEGLPPLHRQPGHRVSLIAQSE